MKRGKKPTPEIERFHTHYEIDSNGCWIWKRYIHKCGYGFFRRFIEGKTRALLAHRVSWEFHNGPIPNGMQVLHKCDVRACVNPAHLFLGTQKENVQDALRKKRFLIGERHQRAKLSDAQVSEIRLSNKKIREIAKLYGICESYVFKLRSRVHRL